MTKLKISDDLSLPVDAVTEKLAFLGRTGSGKTYGAMKLAETMLDAGAQIGALDPVGVWRALRVPATKGGTSYEVVVFGGLYGDLPLEPTAGELIADLVCDRGLSFVLDVSQFIPSEQQRFVRAFADRFFHRKKSLPSAVHLFIEECLAWHHYRRGADEIRKAIAAARAEEREACFVIATDEMEGAGSEQFFTAERIASAIRARRTT